MCVVFAWHAPNGFFKKNLKLHNPSIKGIFRIFVSYTLGALEIPINMFYQVYHIKIFSTHYMPYFTRQMEMIHFIQQWLSCCHGLWGDKLLWGQSKLYEGSNIY